MLRRVLIVAFDRAQALDVVGPLDVFAGASEAQERRRARDLGYEAAVVGKHSRALRLECRLRILPEATLAQVASSSTPVDTLLVAGGAGARVAANDAALLRDVSRIAKRARRVASVCTGAFVLAAAGLLDGRRATTHWAFCEEMARRYPRVRVEADPIFVRDGAVWTSAGVTAGIDVSLAMVEADLGREVASLVARYLVVFMRRAGGQSQFSPPLQAQAAERPPLRDLQAWIVEHPEVPLDVPALARRVAMSERHFSRVFHAEVGLSPAAFVERVRVDAARRLLETTRDGVDAVAARAGFGTSEALRRAMDRQVGLSPREYRARFGASPSGGAS